MDSKSRQNYDDLSKNEENSDVISDNNDDIENEK